MTRWLWIPGESPGLPSRQEVGGKAWHLARMAAAGCRIPPWLAVRAGADPAAALQELAAALERLGLAGKRLAVRSSAVAEDAAGASFAGQFETVLGVTAEDLPEALCRVRASAQSDRVKAYHPGSDPLPVAVIVQEMLDAEAAGVAFTVDPVSGDRQVTVVSAVYGLGEGLVSGELDADTYRIRPSGEVEVQVARKTEAVRLALPRGLRREPVPPERRDEPVLTPEQAREVAEAARRLEEVFRIPQDVEWARAGGKLYLLQSRPVTAAGKTGELRIWDNANIAESYAGVTTPLTFSFARHVYEQAYRQFAEAFGVESRLIAEHRPVFANMLGLIQGRIYYNLLNWYRVLALLPGFSLNRSFMETMMGVRESLPDRVRPPRTDPLRDGLRLTRALIRIGRELMCLERSVKAFHARVERIVGPLEGRDFSQDSPEELIRLYRFLEDELLRHWKPPLVNDFFTMISHGLLVRLVGRWLPGSSDTLINDLMRGQKEMLSARLTRELMALAAEAPRALFAEEPDDAWLWQRLAGTPWRQRMEEYLRRYGCRCAGELKLETVPLTERPEVLLSTVRTYLRQGCTDPEGVQAEEERAFRQAMEGALQQLPGARGWLLRHLTHMTRTRVCRREDMRFERARVFALVRRLLRALGRHLPLEDPDQVFYLTVEEIFGYFEGTGVTGRLARLAELRRREFSAWAQGPPPPDRFETRGPPEAVPLPSTAGDEGELRGLGCCPGRVRAPVRRVSDPHRPGDLSGHIMAAERTDPGWTLLFPAVEGLLVERGSLLSHSAIVARELGIPCIVAIPGLMERLRDGEVVEMDGAAGVVRRSAPAPPEKGA